MNISRPSMYDTGTSTFTHGRSKAKENDNEGQEFVQISSSMYPTEIN